MEAVTPGGAEGRAVHRCAGIVPGFELVEDLDGIPDYDRYGLTERARAFTAELGKQTGYLDALELARLVHEVVLYGTAATETCKGILTNFVEFLRARPGGSGRRGV